MALPGRSRAVPRGALHRGPLFNTYEYGGYLIWRGQRTFIDGRALSESLYQDYRRFSARPPAMRHGPHAIGRYGIGAIVMNGFEYVSGVLYPLAISLAGQPEWQLVYKDAQAMVLLKQPPTGMPVLDKRRLYDHLDAECRLHVTRDPQFPLCARTWATSTCAAETAHGPATPWACISPTTPMPMRPPAKPTSGCCSRLHLRGEVSIPAAAYASSDTIWISAWMYPKQ